MRVLVISHLYPFELNPISGSFVADQVQALRASGVESTVINPFPRVPPFGKYLNDRYRWLAEHGQVSRVVDGVRVEPASYLAVPRNRLFWLGGPTLAWWLSRQAWLQQPRTRFDIVHAHVILPDGFAAVRWGRRHRLPVVCTAHGDDINVDPHFNRLTHAQASWTIRSADAMIAVSGALQERMLQIATPRESRVIPSGIAIESFGRLSRAEARSQLGLPAASPIVLFVGNLLPIKGVQPLMGAFGQLHQAVPDATLVLVGEGPLERELRERATELGIEKAIRFEGRQARDRIPTWMAAADVLVLPSFNEGMPLVVLEAMASGLPVVASDVGGIAEALVPPTAGIVVSPGNETELSRALISVLQDHQLRQQLGAGGHERAKAYSWAKSAERVISLYHDVLAAQQNASDGGSATLGGK